MIFRVSCGLLIIDTLFAMASHSYFRATMDVLRWSSGMDFYIRASSTLVFPIILVLDLYLIKKPETGSLGASLIDTTMVVGWFALFWGGILYAFTRYAIL